MKKQTLPPKSVRRRKVLEDLREFAAEEGYDLDVSNYENLNTFLIHAMKTAGLQPEIVQGNGQIRSRGIDANGYVRGTSMTRTNLRTMRAELTTIMKTVREGGPWEPGDLDALEIATSARAILVSEIGEEWRERISREIAIQYENRHGFGKSYVELNEAIGFKIAQGRILVQAKFGNAYYRNGHIVMTGVRLPEATAAAMTGKPIESLMEGSPYGSAFADLAVIKVECPEQTTIIHLEERHEPASGKETYHVEPE